MKINKEKSDNSLNASEASIMCSSDCSLHETSDIKCYSQEIDSVKLAQSFTVYIVSNINCFVAIYASRCDHFIHSIKLLWAENSSENQYSCSYSQSK